MILGFWTSASGQGLTDNSSGAMAIPGVQTVPVGDTWRGFGSDWFNKSAKENEDFRRAEQSANNALYRDLYYMGKSNEFSANEAQKNRDWQERLSNTAYQRAVADMKLAGINPLLAYDNGGASTPSGSAASSSGSRSSAGYHGSKGGDPLNSVFSAVVKVLAGALTHRPDLVVSGIMDTVVDYDKGKSYIRNREFSYRKK